MWQRFVSNDYRFSSDHPEYHRVYLINAFLFVLGSMFLFFSIADMIAGYHELAALHAIALSMAIVLLYYFQKTSDLLIGSIGALMIATLVIVSFLTMYHYQFYGYYWMVVVVPLAYFLLGSHFGTLYSLLFFGYFITDMVLHYEQWGPAAFTYESIINITIASVVLVALTRYFELSRHEALSIIEEKNRELQRLATTDPLTGLLNRRAFFDLAEKEIGRCMRYANSCAIIMMDIDHFKSINDTHGHQAGDLVLQRLSQLIKKELRLNDLAARFGGEEFVLLISESDLAMAHSIAERLRQQIEQHVVVTDDERISLTVSLGVSVYTKEDKDIDTLIARADEALYIAKHRGRNRVV